jgi:hypothetical protein
MPLDSAHAAGNSTEIGAIVSADVVDQAPGNPTPRRRRESRQVPLIRLVIACLLVVSGLWGIYVGLSGWGIDDATATVVLSGFLALSGAAYLIHVSGLFASLLAAPADDAPTPDVDVVTEEKTKVDAQGSLGAYSAGQWKRILPEKPGRIIWIGPMKGGSAKPSVLSEISADIDRALDVFYAGGTPEGVEKHLLQAGIKIDTGADVGDKYVAYDKDQRPHFTRLIEEIRDILRMVTEQNRDDLRLRILAARDEDIKWIRVNGEGDTIARIGRVFEKYSRVFDVSWNTGYPYTTGESSGNSEELRQEGATEVGSFTANCLAEDYPDILSKIQDLSIAPEDRATIMIRTSGGHVGDGSDGILIGIKNRLREDERAFNIDLSTSRSHDGPEGTDDNCTDPADIRETHYLRFSCDKADSEDLARQMEELVRDATPPVTVTIDP